MSHRVGPTSSNKQRQITVRIKNYDLIHQLLKSSKDLRKISGMERVAVNQDPTKTRNKLAYNAPQLVKNNKAKSKYIGDGKIFVIDNNNCKHNGTPLWNETTVVSYHWFHLTTVPFSLCGWVVSQHLYKIWSTVYDTDRLQTELPFPWPCRTLLQCTS